MIIPSIDLMEGKAVQLRQGKEKVLERTDVLQLARELSMYGEIAVIDLDAAMGKGSNLDVVKQICAVADCRVGGGIRDMETASEILKAGARKIIIGTRADPDFLKKLPKEKLIAAIDTKDDFVVNGGWTKTTGRTPEEKIAELEKYCSEFLFTNVNKEGMMGGCDIEKAKKLASTTKNKLTVAGGITTIDEIKAIEEMGANSQLGMAIYTGKLNLADAFVSLIKFDEKTNLAPTIVQEENGQVLMLAYSSKESLIETFKTKKAAYYSRSRKKLWMKGEVSGNFQEFVKARYDCDRDALLFTVRQKNFACHTGRYSCFGDREFGLDALYEVVADRIRNPKESSYTSKIAKEEKLIKEKISEEADEVVNYKDRRNLVWEIADLAYFVIVLMAKNGISIDEIKNELEGRRK